MPHEMSMSIWMLIERPRHIAKLYRTLQNFTKLKKKSKELSLKETKDFRKDDL